MKKIMLSAYLMAATLFVMAQTKTTDSTTVKTGINGNNEIKVNMLYTILGIPEITYERILNDNAGVGMSVAIGLTDDTNVSYSVIPYYRFYFGTKKANGFFIEGNAALFSMENLRYSAIPLSYAGSNYIHTTSVQHSTNFGLGAAVGGKFLTKNGFVGEIFLGVGRLFRAERDDTYYPRVGITLGKRF